MVNFSEKNADPNVQGSDGDCPVHYLARNLRDHYRDDEWEFIHHYTASQLHTLLRLLASYGADVHKPDGRGRTPKKLLFDDSFPELQGDERWRMLYHQLNR